MSEQPSVLPAGGPWVRITPPKGRFGAYHLAAGPNRLSVFERGWFVWGRKRAERKALRILAKERQRQSAHAAAWTVTDDSH